MSFVGGTFGTGAGPSSALRFSQTRGRIHGSSVQGVNYPSPFFDIAHTYLPVTVKQMFRWCRYYFLTNPLINATVFKLSEYPITDIVIDHKDPEVAKRWTEYFQDHLSYRPFQIECGLDYHCFHGDVTTTTRDGVFRLRDLVGKTVEVLSKNGVYRKAEFKSFGRQELWEVEFGDGRTVLATAEHQWPTITSEGNTLNLPTTEIQGRRLLRNVAKRPEQDGDFFEGVRHGFTFGDGNLYNKGKQARACFFGRKDKEMLKFFEGHGSAPITDSRGVIIIHGMPAQYKKIPDNSSTASYWYGFLCGFLAADGSVDVAGCTVLTQATRSTLEVIALQLARLGMVAGTVRGYYRESQYGSGEMYFLSLFKQYMQPDDFLLSHHRSNFENNYKPTEYGTYAHVRSVRQTGIVDEVFCCVEPETHTFTIDNGVLTGNCYGNAMISIGFPFRKYLHCQSCGFSEQAQKIRHRWIFTNHTFRLTCPGCGVIGDAWAEDKYLKNASGVKLIRWNCEHVEVTYNDVTGESTYFYTIPPTVRNDIVIGKKDVVESTPQVFIQALRQQKGVVFSKQNFFHLKRPTLAQQDRGWGIPMALPVLKDVFYLQMMKKAQEAILAEHIVPLRILFPQAGSGSSDPYVTVNLVDWRDQIASEIARWRHDNNYIPILPLPIGNQTIGGDGRALMLSQEIQQWSEQIMVGMGVPREFLLGGMSYAGTNVSMRMLENQFLGFILRHKQMARWTMKMVAGFMEWPEASIRFKPFKMADDLQRKAYLFQLNQAGKISDTTLLQDTDLSQSEEDDIRLREMSKRIESTKKEQLAMAEVQAEAQLIMAKSQAKAQQVMMEAQTGPVAPGEPGDQMPVGMPAELQSPINRGQQMGVSPAADSLAGAGQQPQPEAQGVDLTQLAQSLAQQIKNLSPESQQMAIQNLQSQSPELAQLVMQLISQMEAQPAHMGIDMRPMPDKLPARRQAQLV